jgi:adenosine deaminase
LRRTYADLVVGYDLVDQEDRFHTLLYYINDFIKIQQYIASNNDLPLPYYFHAGETDWATKNNIFDAILLNTTRIGHGYDLKDYPLLMDVVRERGIAIEVR